MEGKVVKTNLDILKCMRYNAKRTLPNYVVTAGSVNFGVDDRLKIHCCLVCNGSIIYT